LVDDRIAVLAVGLIGCGGIDLDDQSNGRVNFLAVRRHGFGMFKLDFMRLRIENVNLLDAGRNHVQAFALELAHDDPAELRDDARVAGRNDAERVQQWK